MGEDGTWPLFHLPRRSSVAPHGPDERLAETNNEPGEPRQVPRKLGSTESDGQWQLGSPTAANDEKTQTVTGHKRRAPMAATDAPNNASNLQAAVQHNADKEKEKAVEASLWTRVSSPCPKWRRRRLLLPSRVQAPALPVAQHRNSGEKEKTSVLALLRLIHLPYSVASDEKLLETSHGLGTGGPAASRHRAAGRSDRGRKFGTF